MEPERWLRVQEIFAAGPSLARWDGLGGRSRRDGAIERHIDRILERAPVDADAIRSTGLHVALDCVHGAGGRIRPKWLPSGSWTFANTRPVSQTSCGPTRTVPGMLQKMTRGCR